MEDTKNQASAPTTQQMLVNRRLFMPVGHRTFLKLSYVWLQDC